VNLGDARAADVLALIGMAQARVKALTGIDLELEVKVVGED
jgi:UDP-N-acetylenolpyruvoylglucosamine reductase